MAASKPAPALANANRVAHLSVRGWAFRRCLVDVRANAAVKPLERQAINRFVCHEGLLSLDSVRVHALICDDWSERSKRDSRENGTQPHLL